MMRGHGRLGERRLGIAVIWFLPAGESEQSAPTEGLSAEEREQIESMLGMDAEVALERLRGLGRMYRQDRERLHAELLSLTEGDEIATRYLLEFIAKIATGDQSPATSEHEPEESGDGPGGQVLEFTTPKEDKEDDDPEDRE
jgi:hypothetical protein